MNVHSGKEQEQIDGPLGERDLYKLVSTIIWQHFLHQQSSWKR